MNILQLGLLALLSAASSFPLPDPPPAPPPPPPAAEPQPPPAAGCRPTLSVADVLSFRDCRTLEVRGIPSSKQDKAIEGATRVIEFTELECFPKCPVPLEVVKPLNPFWLIGYCGGGGTDLVFTAGVGVTSSDETLRSLSLELVAWGFARAGSEAHERYKAAEASARGQKSGCWASASGE